MNLDLLFLWKQILKEISSSRKTNLGLKTTLEGFWIGFGVWLKMIIGASQVGLIPSLPEGISP